MHFGKRTTLFFCTVMTFLSLETSAQDIGCAFPADKLETKICIDWAQLQGMDVHAWACPAAVTDPAHMLKAECPQGKIIMAESLNLHALRDDRDIADLAVVKRVGTCVRGKETAPLWVCAPEKSRPENLRPSKAEVEERRAWLKENQDDRSLVEKAQDTYDQVNDLKNKPDQLKKKAENLQNKVKSAEKLIQSSKSSGSGLSMPSAPSLPGMPSVPGTPSLPGTPDLKGTSLPKTPVTDPKSPAKGILPGDVQKPVPAQTN